MAISFRDAHAWLGHMGVSYASLTKFKPRLKKRRARRIQREYELRLEAGL